MSLRLLYNNSSGSTFNLIIENISIIGDTYWLEFMNELTDTLTGTTITDTSLYPDKYSTFEITTSDLSLSEGWYRYNVWDDSSKQSLLKFGQCYIYDNEGNVENSPDDTTYEVDKNKYVYDPTIVPEPPEPTGYTIGDIAEGGIISYIYEVGDTGYDPNVEHGLVMMTYDVSTDGQVEYIPDFGVLLNVSGSSLGTGYQNTIDIIDLGYTNLSNCAAALCNTQTESGYTDWFLPSQDEMLKICENKIANGLWTSNDLNENPNWYYWTSTELDTYHARAISVVDSCSLEMEQKQQKTSGVLSIWIRAIRYF